MKNFKVFLFAITAVLAVVGLNSCNKSDEVSDSGTTKTTIANYATIVTAFASDFDDELTSTDESDLKSASLTRCFTLTVDKNADGAFYPRVWTVDYLDGTCTLFSGNTKKGKIHVSLSNFWKNEGSLKTVTFEDYYFNSNKMTGVKTILNTGLNENGNLTFAKTIADASLTYPDGTFISWECRKQSELIGGGSTFLFADDVYSVTGTGSGVNLDGKKYTLTIISPLIYKNGYFYPISGSIEIASDGAEKQTIDYGNGDCDNLATQTVGDVTTEIKL
ncbi:MAG: hypothetical protein K0M40_02175 [Prolixibacteraceae bacterium]|nr:hypothetical protein [Prolixibacteraceae bacterium]